MASTNPYVANPFALTASQYGYNSPEYYKTIGYNPYQSIEDWTLPLPGANTQTKSMFTDQMKGFTPTGDYGSLGSLVDAGKNWWDTTPWSKKAQDMAGWVGTGLGLGQTLYGFSLMEAQKKALDQALLNQKFMLDASKENIRTQTQQTKAQDLADSGVGASEARAQAEKETDAYMASKGWA